MIGVGLGFEHVRGSAIAVKLAVQQGHHVEKDSHGNVQLSGSGALGDFLSIHIKNNLGKNLRVRADTFGYLQRSFAGCVSRVDQQEAREAGRCAARCAMSGDIDGSIAIQRINNHPYKIDYKRIELSDVAGKTQTLDPRYIVDGRDIDSSFRDYALPLVGQLPAIELLRTR